MLVAAPDIFHGSNESGSIFHKLVKVNGVSVSENTRENSRSKFGKVFVGSDEFLDPLKAVFYHPLFINVVEDGFHDV